MELKPTVIALLGRAGSGKSTAAKHIVEEYGARKVSFAGPLKELARLLMDFSDEQLYGTQEAKETVDPRYGMTSRQFLQRLGNGARETIGRDVWANALLFNILQTFSREGQNASLFVIDDCRYRNEAKMIVENEAWNGFVVKLECPDAQTVADPNHPSEAEVDMVPPDHISRRIVSCRSPGSKDLLDRVTQVMQDLDIGKVQ